MNAPQPRGVVHVASHHPATGGVDGGGYVSGRELERVEAAERRWHERGYEVGPAPVDGQDHPHDKLCPICKPGEW